MKYLFLAPIRLYQIFLSPWVGHHCRFVPSCSHYTCEAIQRHGPFKGSLLGLSRLLSCHPFSRKESLDPVPERFAWGDLIGYKKRASNEDL